MYVPDVKLRPAAKIPVTPVAGWKLRVCLTGSYSTGINAPREAHTELLVKNRDRY